MSQKLNNLLKKIIIFSSLRLFYFLLDKVGTCPNFRRKIDSHSITLITVSLSRYRNIFNGVIIQAYNEQFEF